MNMNKVYKTVTAVGLGAYLFIAPVKGEAFYVSQKEAQKAGIKTSEITKTRLPMGDKVSYKGHVEDNETFDDIAGRVHEWAEDFFGTNLSYRTTRKVLVDFNYYKKIEMPSVSVPCTRQYAMGFIQELEKEMKQSGKPGPMEKDLEFLKGKLGELEKLYNAMDLDITELKEKDIEQDEMIEELEKRLPAKDYDRKRSEMESEEPRERLGSTEREYAQPPVAGYGYGDVIFGQPGWFPDLPYPYLLLNGAIYCTVPFGNTFYYRRWGWFEPYDGGFRARRLDGRIFNYHGPRDLPFHEGWMGHRGLPDGKRLGNREKDIDPRGRSHERGHLPDLRDHRLEGKSWNNGKGFDPRGPGKNQSREDSWTNRGLQRGQVPKIREDGRNRTMGRGSIPRQDYRGGFPQGGRQQNFQGHGFNVQPRNFGNQGNYKSGPGITGNRGSGSRNR